MTRIDPVTHQYAFRVAEPDAAGPGAEPATAILVWHGMGQQVAFETIEIVSRVLVQEERRRTGQLPVVTPRQVDFGGEKLCRLEFDVTRNGRPHRVHVYEAYWAPLTEGAITLAEVVKALLGAGVDGIRYGLLPPRVLPRFLFGRLVEFPLSPLLALVYFALMLAVLALVIVNFVVGLSSALALLRYLSLGGLQAVLPLLQDLTIDLAVLAVTFGVTGAAFGLVYLSHRSNQRDAAPAVRQPLVQAVLWTLVAATLAAVVLVGGAVTWHLVVHQYSEQRRFAITLPMWTAALVWAAVVVGSAVVRWFLLEFVGDSVIYIASHQLNRFYATRHAIKDMSTKLAAAVYEHGNYREHIIVGHSLGSVIAYDTLNALISDDRLIPVPRRVTERTPLFLTFGSVLDKTAFLFRVQSTFSDIREVLAAVVQPLISDPAARPSWVNIYSPNDVLGGSLEYYDPKNGIGGNEAAAAQPIANLRDPDAWVPILAHNQYWTNQLFVRTLIEAITVPHGFAKVEGGPS